MLSKSDSDKIIKIVRKIQDILSINNDNPLEKQVLSAYLFGMINKFSQDYKWSKVETEAILIRILIENLRYTEKESVELSEFLIQSTSPEFHPTINAIIHRGIEAAFLYESDDLGSLKEDFMDILFVLNE